MRLNQSSHVSVYHVDSDWGVCSASSQVLLQQNVALVHITYLLLINSAEEQLSLGSLDLRVQGKGLR